jgi:hypothetical protein
MYLEIIGVYEGIDQVSYDCAGPIFLEIRCQLLIQNIK